MAKEKTSDAAEEKPADTKPADTPAVADVTPAPAVAEPPKTRRFDVSLLNGSRQARISVPRIPPRCERQKMNRLDEKGKTVTEVVDVPVDVDAEMAADAVRAYNGTGPEATNYTAKQLVVTAVD